MKILIISLSGIGDSLLFTPALTFLRNSLPDAQIDALVMFKGSKDIFDRNPHFNKVIHFDFLKKGAINSIKFLLSLRNKYTATINVYPSNRKEYNIISFIIGAKQRAAVKYLRQDSKNLGYLNNIRVLEDDLVHNVNTNIKLCEKFLDKKIDREPALNLPLTEKDISFAEKYLSEKNISDKELVIGFHPGSAVFKNHIKRRWEPEKFIILGKKLIDENKAKILIFGGLEEDELKNFIKSGIASPDTISVSAPDLPSSAAVMKRCNVFVTNDSSLMHVASALQLNVVALIGPTNINYIHPWKTEHKIVSLNLECSPCFIYSPRPLKCFRDDVKFKCIKELNVEMANEAVNYFLKKV